MENYANQCRLVAWSSFVIGISTGLILGLWSFNGPFPTPEWLGEYDNVSRRLVRLGHIAFFGLGILNLLLAMEIPKLKLSTLELSIASKMMIFGNMVLPLTLLAAGVWHPLKYLMPIPALCVLIAMCLAAKGAWQRYMDLTND